MGIGDKELVIRNWGLGIEIGDRDWGLGLGIWIGIGD